jgi:hypothetical protein
MPFHPGAHTAPGHRRRHRHAADHVSPTICPLCQASNQQQQLHHHHFNPRPSPKLARGIERLLAVKALLTRSGKHQTRVSQCSIPPFQIPSCEGASACMREPWVCQVCTRRRSDDKWATGASRCDHARATPRRRRRRRDWLPIRFPETHSDANSQPRTTKAPRQRVASNSLQLALLAVSIPRPSGRHGAGPKATLWTCRAERGAWRREAGSWGGGLEDISP